MLEWGGVNAGNATLDQLEAAYGATSDWKNSLPASYPVNVLDATIFGSDANSQTTNANVNNYDYIYFEVTDFVSARAVRVFFWDPNQNKRLNYFLKPVADKETANYETETTVSAAGTYCVKIPDGARLQGAKTPWTSSAASDPYFKFSSIYLTERETPYVELVPYTLVWTPNAGTYRATIPLSESHIRATGGVTINYTTGEVNCTGSGALTIYLNNEDLVGATGYNMVTSGNVLLGSNLGITDAVNGEVGGIYGSRNSWHIAGDDGRKNKIGAVTALKYNFDAAGTWTITSIYFDADLLVATTTNKSLVNMLYGEWTLPANAIGSYLSNDSYITNNIGNTTNGIVYGHDANSDKCKYVDLTNCSKMIFNGSSVNGGLRLFYNWSGTDGDKPIEIITDFPTSDGTYVFDIDAFKKSKGISFFHLNGIKSKDGQNVSISSITVDEYDNVIKGSGIDKTKAYLLNPYITSIDATGITAATSLPTANPNCLIVANAGKVTNDNNVIVDDVCANLVLTDGKPFKAPAAFTATAAKFTKTVSEAGYATMVIPFAAALPTGVKAYNLTGVAGESITYSSAETIAANSPVMIEANENVSGYEFTASNVEIAATANGVVTNGLLNGGYATMTAAVDANNYVLQKNGDDVNFYLVTGTAATVKPFRAYLTAPATARELTLNFGETTGISASLMNSDERIVKSEVYNLNGQRVAAPQKGLYIVNGKKVIVK